VRSSISVAIPVHNGLPFLQAALRSVFDQTLQPDEIIVVENKSTDGTFDYLKDLSHPLVRIVVQDKLVSAPDNWSRAAQETRGDFVKLLCADDIIQPHALELQRKTILDHQNVVLVAGRRSIIDEKDNVIIQSRGLAGLRGVRSREEIIKVAALSGTNIVGEVGGILFDGGALRDCLPWPKDYGYVTDLVQYERVLRKGGAYFMGDTVAKFRTSPQSWSSTIRNRQTDDFNRLIDEWVSEGLDLSRFERTRSRVASRVNQLSRQALYASMPMLQRVRSLTN
jgi:glycosyltransferase involved in cell wall biosynthesis